MGKFAIKEVSTGYVFNLKATNGQVIGVSQTYKTLEGCKGGIESVKTNAPVANLEDQTVEGFEAATHPKFEVYTDKAGEFRFRLKAKNGEIILASEGYATKPNCLNGVESVKNNAPSADVE